MASSASSPFHLWCTLAELPPSERVWGTGGWLEADTREALDWLTLARLLGWGVRVERLEELRRKGDSCSSEGAGGAPHWIVVACDPDDLGAEDVALLAARVAADPVLVVARAASPERPLSQLAGTHRLPETWSGRDLRCLTAGAERDWRCGTALESRRLAMVEGTVSWATLDGAPVVATRRVGRGAIATLGFHPSRARDAAGAATALLIHLLTRAAVSPVAWLDWSGCLVLRMDDPGGAQNVHSRSWSYPKLDTAVWTEIRADLRRRQGRISLGYVAGWVDDGDSARGVLWCLASRQAQAGTVYPSHLLRYRDRAGTLHDYEAEYRGIQALRSEGLGDVELHGFTHMHPDSRAWAECADRYESWPATSWYRELGPAAQAVIAARSPDGHPLVLGRAAFRDHFGIEPTTLICPGDQWTISTLEQALDLGLFFVASYYLAIRDGDRFCWSIHTCAPYLNEPSASWFDAGLPVVGYFHDREPAIAGVGWMSHCIDQWQAAGATRLIDFRELAAALGRHFDLRPCDGQWRLTVGGCNATALVRPLPVMVRFPNNLVPSSISAAVSGAELPLTVESLGADSGRVVLPADHQKTLCVTEEIAHVQYSNTSPRK